MTYIRRLLCAALALGMLAAILGTALAATPDDYDPQDPAALQTDHLYAESAFLFDMDTHEVLLSKNSRVRVYPASTTKIMTCILALESGISLDQTVTIPKEAANVPEGSSVVGVRQGDEITWRDLLYGLMLRSGNDAANAIAVLTAGSIDAFVQRMNAKAAELGCEGTHFVNAHGYHDSDHYTTAQDLARMALYAMQDPDFREMAAAAHRTLSVTRKGKVVTQDAENRNSLVVPESNYYYAGANGIKTGHHNKSGRCVVASATRDGINIMAIVMDTATEERQFADARKLFDYGFSQYAPYTMKDLLERVAPEVNSVRVENAAQDDPGGGTLLLNLGQIEGGEATRMIQTGSEKAMTLALDDVRSGLDIQWTRALEAPVAEGEVMGTLAFDAPDGTRVTAQLTASRAVEARPEPTPTPTPTAEPRPNAPTVENERRGSGALTPLLAAAGVGIGLALLALAVLQTYKKRARKRRSALRRRARRKKASSTASRRAPARTGGNSKRGGNVKGK
ncbi:MAG: D-alanyl-D-alanine carboxypeptidase [Clostridia bacterium]|nr:D-alanyl-D-alanine carboxypeptidase [Clostridia bacterium]